MTLTFHSIFCCEVIFMLDCPAFSSFFFFNDTATTEIYTLSLHDALPIFGCRCTLPPPVASGRPEATGGGRDRKSTRLNSSHQIISYAVFCLKKKKDYTSKRYSSLHRNSRWY